MDYLNSGTTIRDNLPNQRVSVSSIIWSTDQGKTPPIYDTIYVDIPSWRWRNAYGWDSSYITLMKPPDYDESNIIICPRTAYHDFFIQLINSSQMLVINDTGNMIPLQLSYIGDVPIPDIETSIPDAFGAQYLCTNFMEVQNIFSYDEWNVAEYKPFGKIFHDIFYEYKEEDVQYMLYEIANAPKIFEHKSIGVYPNDSVIPKKNFYPRMLITNIATNEPNARIFMSSSWQVMHIDGINSDKLYYHPHIIGDYDEALMRFPPSPLVEKRGSTLIFTFPCYVTNRTYMPMSWIKLNQPLHISGNIKYLDYPPKPNTCRQVFTTTNAQHTKVNGRIYTANAKKSLINPYDENAKTGGGCGSYGD